MAWPGSSRLGSSSAQLSSAQHGPAQCGPELVLAWLRFAQLALASAVQLNLGPYRPVGLNLYFVFKYLTIHAKTQHKISFRPVGLSFGIRIRLGSTRLRSAQQFPAQLNPAPLRSAWLGSGLPAQFTARLSSSLIGSYLFCSVLLISVWLSCCPTVKLYET